MSSSSFPSIIFDQDIQVDLIKEPIKEDTIITLLLDSLDKNLGNIVLSESEINVLKEFISISPIYLNDINKCILEIIKDGKIDALDIPSLIKILKDIYILSHEKITIKVSDLVTTIGSMLKYIIQVIIVNNNLASPELLKSLNELIDITVEMIKFNTINKSKTWFFGICLNKIK